MPEKLFDKLLTARNKRMAHKIDSLSRIQSTFFAFGAAHLPGQGGAIDLLRKKGFTVESIVPTFNRYLKDGWYAYSQADKNFSVAFPGTPSLSKIRLQETVEVNCFEIKSTHNHYKLYSYIIKKDEQPLSINNFYALEFSGIKPIKAKEKNTGRLKIKATEITANCKGERTRTFFTFQNGLNCFVVVLYNDSNVDETEENKFLNSIQLNPS